VKAAGKPVELIVAPDYNHFEMGESLNNPYGPNGRAALALMKLAPVAPRGAPQTDLVLCLNSLGQIGDEPRARYERILTIMHNLEREKKLTTEQITWIAAAERFLATLPR